jgi:hypothetical protein
MSEIETGGPAFPVPYHPEQQWENPAGMSLRDYFAAKAMAAIISRVTEADGSMTANAIGCATDGAYFIADEMLRARGQS